MTPDDIELVEGDVAHLSASADRFTAEFYATLFDLDPDVRRLFPADIDAQRAKLFEELGVLVSRATQIVDDDSVAAFVARAHELGERHEVYGVTAPMYRLVEISLLAALRDVVPDFDDGHERAWTRLYRLVAGSMQDG